MRVAIVLERTDTSRGGAETSIRQYARALVRRGVRVHLVTATPGRPSGDLRYDRIAAPSPNAPGATGVFVRRARRFLRDHEFDVVHAVTPVPGADIYQPRGGTLIETGLRNVAVRPSRAGRWAKRITACCRPKRFLLRRLETNVLHADPPPIVVAVSQYVATQLRQHYDLDPRRIRVVFNGVDLADLPPDDDPQAAAELRATYRVPDRAVVMLAVAHNFKLKGIEPLIRATGRLVADNNSPEIRILIVGRDNPVRYQALARKLGVEDHVIFTGPTERVAWFYRGADALVHPTFYDPCSRVVLEALVAGLPCITTRHNGAAEIMCDGREGFIIESPHDVETLADRMGRLGDAKLRSEFSVRAAMLRGKIDMNRHVDEMLDVYESVRRAS